MKISLNLIKRFTDIKLEGEELLERIGSRLAEIDEIIYLKERYEGIVVGEIVEAKEHPDADKLGVYRVATGSKQMQVVAGDKTLRAGNKVAYIPPGNTVPSTFDSDKPLKLKKVSLRGKESNGMMASGAELGFNDDHSGVLKLDPGAKTGQSLVELFELDDIVIDIETKTLTHRPECFGHIGFAREIAGIQDIKFTSPKWLTTGGSAPEHDSSLKLGLKNEVAGLVPRVTLRAFSDVEVRPSPLKVQSYLSRLGVKPINNVVDATNYVMLMTAQPTHAFDYDKVAAKSKGPGAQVVVRKPKKGEKLKILDGRVIEPHKDAVLIATDVAPLSIGGAIGGSDSEVDSGTKRVIIEAANFDLYNIRQTSMQHGIFTEAVTRFARGQDPEMCQPVQNHIAGLIGKWSSAKAASPLLDEYAKDARRRTRSLSVDPDFINLRLGTSYTKQLMQKTLNNVEVNAKADSKLRLKIPTWRVDLSIAEDIVEEIGRLNGFDNIKTTSPKRTLEAAALDKIQRMQDTLRDGLSAAGGNEVLSYNFVSGQSLEGLGLDKKSCYHIRNSISPELEYMRPAVLASLTDKAYPNIRRGFDEFLLFEIGKSHNKRFEKDKLPLEQLSLAAVYSAKEDRAAFYEAARYLRRVAELGRVDSLELTPLAAGQLPGNWLAEPLKLLSANRAALVEINGHQAGVVGELRPSVITANKLPASTAVFELDLRVLAGSWRDVPAYSPVSKYPPHEQDITFKVEDDTTYGELTKAVRVFLAKKYIVQSLDPLSIYRAKPSSKRNISYRIRLRSDERTLNTKEVNKLLDNLAGHLQKTLKAIRVV